MTNSTLTIRYCDTRQRETVAWFVAGTRPEQWLTELSRWPLPMDRLTLRPLPADKQPGEVAGVLVTATGEHQSMVSPGCQEYGVMAGRFFLPVEARLEPRALESEIADLMAGSDDDYVFHPSIGLVRIERRERLSVADLLRPPPGADTDWNCAQPGTAPLRPLVLVEPDGLPTAEDVLLDAQDDIATEDPRELPKRASSGRRSRSGSAGESAIGNWLVRALRGWLARLGQGMANLRDQVGTRIDRGERNEPVDRLLRMLQEDPDEGLRYALPLEGTPRRGSAPAGSELTRRKIEFNLQQLFGSGPAGIWEVSQRRFESLRDKYRELANRELSLGRHRRAAYIFAHLLGDMHSAAAALRAGAHWREAAILYRDRLDRPQIAAECLEQGQLWTEAIDLYLQLESFERVGDLYRKIGQDEQADEAFRRPDEASDCRRLSGRRSAGGTETERTTRGSAIPYGRVAELPSSDCLLESTIHHAGRSWSTRAGEETR